MAAAIESALLILYCSYMTWQYAAKGRTPIYVYVLTVVSLYLSFMIIFLLPLDIYTVKPANILSERNRLKLLRERTIW